MKKVVVTEYCDRCKKELPRSKIYHDMFSSDRLDIKFDRMIYSKIHIVKKFNSLIEKIFIIMLFNNTYFSYI